MTYADLRELAMLLPDGERAELARELLVSLGSPSDAAPELDPEWVEELNRRIQSIEDGTAKFVDLDEAMNKARQALVRQRKS